MRDRATIEVMVGQRIQAALARQRVEDSLIELKREASSDFRKVARQIAAICNASSEGEAVWVIGFDEDRLQFQAPSEEMSDWWHRVESHFDGPSPPVRTYFTTIESNSILILHFDASAKPFVVSRDNGDKEVPWRSQNSTRNATRYELLTLLVPRIHLPSTETLRCSISWERQSRHVNCRMQVYVTPRGGERVVIPAHRCALTIHSGSQIFTFPPNCLNWYKPHGHEIPRPVQMSFSEPEPFMVVARCEQGALGLHDISDTPKVVLELGMAGRDVKILVEECPRLVRADAQATVFEFQHPQWFMP